MNFKIFNGKKTLEEVHFKLVKGCNGICIVTCDASGTNFPGGLILSLNDKGVTLYEWVSDRLGLPLDSKGRVKVIEE